jgi:serine/threonine protein kinase/WD40 repeat protein
VPDSQEAPPTATAVPAPPLGDPTVPRVPGYEVLEELGRGGMGVVYKAREAKLNRVVALKMILAAEHAGEQGRTRFRTEARAVARLRHPGIIQIHEVGEYLGRPFVALEYVGGGSLDRYLGRHPLPARDAALLAEQLARAMQHAHDKGIVHRDLKPANILVDALSPVPGSSDSETLDVPPTLTLKIADFGLAKQLDSGDGLTGSQALVGTPSYMAPEQARGQVRAIGPVTDVYALGATLYEMLTGRPPFRGATPSDTILQVLNDDPVPPRQIQPRLPRDLETICLKALAKDPARRYASAKDLADDLLRFREGKPIQARPTALPERLLKWVRRRPALAGLVGLVALTTLGLLLAGFGVVSRSHRQRLHAEELTRQAEEAREETEASAAQMKKLAVEESRQRAQADDKRNRIDYNRQLERLNLGWLALDRGLRLCERDNDPRRGMLWFARALELAQVTDAGLKRPASALDRVARRELAAWVGQLPARVVLLLPHPRGVECAAFRPDGRRLLTGSADGKARWWDAQTGRPVGVPLAHELAVRSVGWSRDGKRIATGTGDGWNVFGPTARTRGGARLWDATSGKPLGPPLPHGGTVFAVAFSPDGKLLLTGCHDRRARLWDVSSGKLVAEVKHDAPVTGVAFHPDGTTFVTATCQDTWNGGSKTARVQWWDTMAQKPRGPAVALNNVRALDVGGKAPVVRTGSQNGHLHFHDAAGKPAHANIFTGSAVAALAFSPDGRTAVTAGTDFRVRVWDVNARRRIGPELYHAVPVTSVAFAADGKTFFSGDEQVGHLWRLDLSSRSSVALDNPGKIGDVGLSPTGREVIVRNEAGYRLWDTATGRPLGSLWKLAVWPRILDLGRDGHTLLVGDTRNRLHLRDARTGAVLSKKEVTAGGVNCAALAPDGQHAVTGGEDEVARVWDLKAGEQLHEINLSAIVSAVDFAPDGKTFAVGTWRSQVHPFDTLSGKPAGKPVGVHGAVICVALGSDGRTILASAHGPFYTFAGDTKEGKTSAEPLRFHAQQTAISVDGRTLLTADNHDNLRIWDAVTNRALGPVLKVPGLHSDLGWGRSRLRTAVFLDDQTVLTAGRDGRMRRWPIAPPVEGPAARIALWVQVRGGLALDSHGGVTTLSEPQWQQAQQQLRQFPGPGLP